MYRKHLSVLAICLALLLVGNGCRSRRAEIMRRAAAANKIGNITESDIFGMPLSDRPQGGLEYANQFSPVYFNYDSASIEPSARSYIEAVANHLQSERAVNVIIEGHCDERGSREYNLALGERRALAIRAYLIGLGIDGARIQTKSYGEESPTAYGHEEEAWRLNRRGEFVLFY